MQTKPLSFRLPADDHRWVEALARRNQIRTSAMARALLHGVRMAAEQGRIKELDMGVLALK